MWAKLSTFVCIVLERCLHFFSPPSCWYCLCSLFELCMSWNCQCLKGLVNFQFVLWEKKMELSHQLCIVCFWKGLLCSNWLCRTEELDEAQTKLWPFYLASGVDYISIKKYQYCDFSFLIDCFTSGWNGSEASAVLNCWAHTGCVACDLRCVLQPLGTCLQAFKESACLFSRNSPH